MNLLSNRIIVGASKLIFGFMRWTEDEPIAILPIARMRHFSVQKLKMAPVNVDNNNKMAVFSQILRERSRRRALQQSLIISFLRRKVTLKAYFLSLLLLLYDKDYCHIPKRLTQQVY